MKMYHRLVFILLISVQSMVARLEVLDIDPTHVELLSTQEFRFCWISFVKIDGEKYLIKQKKARFLRKIVGVVRDAITAHIAETFGIAHEVDIIPAGVEFPGKPIKDWPATIHTVAPGKEIKRQNSPYSKMNIQQKEVGFRYDMFKWMLKHPELIIIIALDTFLCNHDRHRGNLFYNPKTDSFCAIDMDSSFRHNLCAINYKNIIDMINDRRLRLTRKEIHALMEFKTHLQFLIENHPPIDTVTMYDYFSVKAGFIPGSGLYTEKVVSELACNRAMIMQSYADAKKLVKMLRGLIKKSKKNLNGKL